jgi:hypothetical protein
MTHFPGEEFWHSEQAAIIENEMVEHVQGSVPSAAGI